MTDRPLTTGEGNTAPEWAREYDIDCVVCPVCAFTFDKCHVTDTTGEYDCPVCECGRLREQLDAARQALEAIADHSIVSERGPDEDCDWHCTAELVALARAALGVESAVREQEA